MVHTNRSRLNEIMYSLGFLAKKESQKAVTLADFLSRELWRKEEKGGKVTADPTKG